MYGETSRTNEQTAHRDIPHSISKQTNNTLNLTASRGRSYQQLLAAYRKKNVQYYPFLVIENVQSSPDSPEPL